MNIGRPQLGYGGPPGYDRPPDFQVPGNEIFRWNNWVRQRLEYDAWYGYGDDYACRCEEPATLKYNDIHAVNAFSAKYKKVQEDDLTDYSIFVKFRAD
uniref:Uncharacterized protein n=1 Tax=Panagrolaimus superbus TaxID=310955 RepID=A0A914Y146_9BILA